MKIAHLSDLHFSKISLSLGQLFSKRWIGNLNLLVSRKKAFNTERLVPLIDIFIEEGVEYVIITGDLSTTSLKSEFEQALAFVNALEKAGMKTFVLPGNHDHYTKKAHKQRLFYHYFPSPLQEKQVSKIKLSQGWWLVSLDTALATPLFSSQGIFPDLLENELIEILDSIPSTDKVLLANHFPLFENDGPRKAMIRSDALKQVLKRYPQVLFYLHGHTHRHTVADLRPNHLPIILESGSPTLKEGGAWHLLTISPQEFKLKVFHFDDSLKWQPFKQLSFAY